MTLRTVRGFLTFGGSIFREPISGAFFTAHRVELKSERLGVEWLAHPACLEAAGRGVAAKIRTWSLFVDETGSFSDGEDTAALCGSQALEKQALRKVRLPMRRVAEALATPAPLPLAVGVEHAPGEPRRHWMRQHAEEWTSARQMTGGARR